MWVTGFGGCGLVWVCVVLWDSITSLQGLFKLLRLDFKWKFDVVISESYLAYAFMHPRYWRRGVFLWARQDAPRGCKCGCVCMLPPANWPFHSPLPEGRVCSADKCCFRCTAGWGLCYDASHAILHTSLVLLKVLTLAFLFFLHKLHRFF